MEWQKRDYCWTFTTGATVNKVYVLFVEYAYDYQKHITHYAVYGVYSTIEKAEKAFERAKNSGLMPKYMKPQSIKIEPFEIE